MVNVKVVIGKNEIEKGRPNECDACPIALALLKSFPKSEWVSVGTELEIMGSDDNATCFNQRTTKSLLTFMDTFDEGKKVSPFSFIIQISNKLAKVLKPSEQYILKEVASGKS